MLMLLLLAADPPPPPELDVGVAALKAKRPDEAIAALARCAESSAECRWQLGWAYWQKRAWAQVVATWEALDPSFPGLTANLSIARGQAEVARIAARAREAAPLTLPRPEVAGASLRLRAVGDMMIGTAFPEGVLPPDEGAGAFGAVADLLRDADVTFGNLEGPLCDATEPSEKCRPDAKPGSCYAFRTPTTYASRYKDAGFDVVSTANNHAFDFGEACRDQTQAALDRLGILHSGRPGTVARWTTNGLRVALIGFHTSPSCHDLNDTDTAVALVRGLAADNDLVIVSFHGGAEGSRAQHVPEGHEEFYGEDRGDLRRFTHAVIDAGADLVLGHGPHVLRGMEVYQDRLIAYSLGNFSTYGRFNLSGPQGVGAILEVTLSGDGRLAGGRILGTVQEGQGQPRPDPENAAADLVRALSQQDFPRSAPTIAQDGSLGGGLAGKPGGAG
jgi:poly-gamma-glutamate capsule biosynthesis protein CapA/YwtB (metallophosphatase superfamily)